MPFLLAQQRRVIYASDQMQPNSIHALKGFILQRFFYSFWRSYQRSLFYSTLVRKKQPAVITAFILRLPHNVTKFISHLYGIFGTQESKICPQAHMLSYGTSHIGHGDLTHQHASSFIKDNGGTWFDINGDPRAVLQLQLSLHSVKLLLHNAALFFHGFNTSLRSLGTRTNMDNCSFHSFRLAGSSYDGLSQLNGLISEYQQLQNSNGSKNEGSNNKMPIIRRFLFAIISLLGAVSA